MLSPVSDLSLSGYEFYDTVMQNMGRNDPQENDGEDQFGAAEGDASDKELKDLVVVDKVPGTGSLVMKKSVAHFYYLILNTDGAVVSRNDQGTSPVCFGFIQRLHGPNTDPGDSPHGKY